MRLKFKPPSVLRAIGTSFSTLVEVGEEEISILIEGKAGIAAGIAQIVVIADEAPGPGPAAVEAHTLEHPSRQSCFPVPDVADDDDVVRVCRVDGDRFFGLIQVSLADVDVHGNVDGGGSCTRRTAQQRREDSGHSEGAQGEKSALHVVPPSSK